MKLLWSRQQVKEEFYMNELQDTLEEIMEIFKCQEDILDILENQQYRSLLAQKEIQKLNAHIARLAESDLVLVENQKLIEANRKLLAENEKAQNTFKEAVTKTEDAKRILAQAKALNDTFDKCVRDKVSHVKRNMEV